MSTEVIKCLDILEGLTLRCIVPKFNRKYFRQMQAFKLLRSNIILYRNLTAWIA